MPNHLIDQTSPYLLQHAHNPVDWFPWGEEALKISKERDKPILLSIGYSACHWCHVMERESFEDDATAAFMNNHFVNIKVDREERPDLDHIYMDAVQAMTGQGGWPLNVFLTPDTKPFYGGTYYPPVPMHNRPSWKQVLESISAAYRGRKEELLAQSDYLLKHIQESNHIELNEENTGLAHGVFQLARIEKIKAGMLAMADKQRGGFGRAPKFPQVQIIRFLLDNHFITGDPAALSQAFLSLDKMIAGGIYDQIGGGFARYSTDDDWKVPHFEKMLYDNAQLITALAEAYQISRKETYREAIVRSMDFIEREMTGNEGGFYSALDADSEGVEGKYYVWTLGEIESVLGPDAGVFARYFQVTEAGNWEGSNILYTTQNLADFARAEGLEYAETSALLERAKQNLLAARNPRRRPGLDDKMLLGWNALMNIACSRAFAALGIEKYRLMARRNMKFLLEKYALPGGKGYYHTFKNGTAKIPAFLDDYAGLISALLQLQEISGNTDYLEQARDLCNYVIDQFEEKESGFFFYTKIDQKDVLIRKKELYDGAIPSGNAQMAFNLLYLSVIFDIPEWKLRAVKMSESMAKPVEQHPVSFGLWATLQQALTYGISELVITGEHIDDVCKEFLRNFIPCRVFQSATSQNHHFPLLKDKPFTNPPLLFFCTDYTCQNPVNEVDELIRHLKSSQMRLKT